MSYNVFIPHSMGVTTTTYVTQTKHASKLGGSTPKYCDVIDLYNMERAFCRIAQVIYT